MTIMLRLLDNAALHNGTGFDDLAVVQTGTLVECNDYAKREGYEFCQDNSVWGGYFKNGQGDCLLPDLAPGSPRKPARL
jgi:hypothetical protein